MANLEKILAIGGGIVIAATLIAIRFAPFLLIAYVLVHFARKFW